MRLLMIRFEGRIGLESVMGAEGPGTTHRHVSAMVDTCHGSGVLPACSLEAGVVLDAQRHMVLQRWKGLKGEVLQLSSIRNHHPSLPPHFLFAPLIKVSSLR